MKTLIFDAGALINFSINGLTDLFKELKSTFPGEFLITEAVKYETIEHPKRVKRFEWGALRIQDLLNKGIVKLAEDRIVDKAELRKRSKEILDTANNTFFAKNEAIHILDKGEAECLALSTMLSEKKQDNLVVIDERTARMLCENPENLKKLMKKKLHTKITAKTENYYLFTSIKIIRSTELAYIAHKKGLVKVRGEKTLQALLYALKFGGCSISEKEVQMVGRMNR